jgi:hypothetical protein
VQTDQKNADVGENSIPSHAGSGPFLLCCRSKEKVKVRLTIAQEKLALKMWSPGWFNVSMLSKSLFMLTSHSCLFIQLLRPYSMRSAWGTQIQHLPRLPSEQVFLNGRTNNVISGCQASVLMPVFFDLFYLLGKKSFILKSYFILAVCFLFLDTLAIQLHKCV